MNNIVSKIHQGQYDTEKQLLTLRDNALDRNRKDVLDAVNQRLKKCFPKTYQRLVGPLNARIRDKKFKCYCNNPKSLHEIYKDIISNKVHYHALTCDACWQEDLAKTWGYYGWASKLISLQTWQDLCDERGCDKFASY